MKFCVIFPNVMYREGASGVERLIRGIETIGFDQLDMFDHVAMGYPTDTRRAPFYSPDMPILEAFTLLSFAAAVTRRIGLGTGVLVLPQRSPTLVAKQVATLDTLSEGRMRLGVGVGWQRAEYEALGQDFRSRGPRMDEAIQILRAYWQEAHVNFDGTYYQLDEMAMEPKPPQGGGIPIWIGGTKLPALRRAATLGDGWMAMSAPGDPPLPHQLATLRRYADAAGRDFATLGLQMALSPDPEAPGRRRDFFADPLRMQARGAELSKLGFNSLAIDCVPLFQNGHRTVAALLDYLQEVYDHLVPLRG